MKAITEHLIVAVIAILMAFVGYWLMEEYPIPNMAWRNPDTFWGKPGWIIWSSGISVVTWMYLYRMCRQLHWLVLPVMGVFSPLIGALLFFVPYFIFPFIIVWKYAIVIFPVGIVTGFLFSAATLPFRPQAVMKGNS